MFWGVFFWRARALGLSLTAGLALALWSAHFLRRALESEIQEPYAWRDDRHRARARVDPEVPVMPSSHPTIRAVAGRRDSRG